MPEITNIKEKIKDLQTDLVDYEISNELSQRIAELQTDLEPQRERTATFLAYTVSIAFCGVIALPLLFVFLFNKTIATETSDFIKSILPAVSAILGLVFGFYFSEKRL